MSFVYNSPNYGNFRISFQVIFPGVGRGISVILSSLLFYHFFYIY